MFPLGYLHAAHASSSKVVLKENPTSSTSSSSGKTKLKQVILDHIFPRKFPKKRKIEETTETENDERLQQEFATVITTAAVEKTETKSLETKEINKVGNPNDIGNYVNKAAFTKEENYHLLRNVCKPPASYKFPMNESKRRFCYEWFRIFLWLVYSEKVDGAFCMNCVLFGPESIGTHNSTKLQRLYKLPFNAWKVAPVRFREHSEKSELHKTATTQAAMFRSFMEKKTTPVDVMLDDLKKQQIEENRKLIRPIINAIVLCGRQNIPLRGHRDDSQYYLSDDVNPGNFIEILKYGVTCTGQSLEEYFKSTPKNITYKSKTTQNEIIDICDDLITRKITNEIREANFFSILADEASDCGNVEQLSIVVRFVDKKHQIGEKFLGFVPCKTGVSGEAVANTIQEFLGDRNLSIDDCRGQGYDGAGNIAGRISGVAARIQQINKKAFYVHCNSHMLNLCVAACGKEQLVSNMMEHVRVVSEFFNFSPKRFSLLVKTIEEMLPESSHERLINVCKTRWVARIDGLSVFIEVFPAFMRCFEIIRDNINVQNLESRVCAESWLFVLG